MYELPKVTWQVLLLFYQKCIICFLNEIELVNGRVTLIEPEAGHKQGK